MPFAALPQAEGLLLGQPSIPCRDHPKAPTHHAEQTDDLKARALVAQASVHQGLGEVGAAIDVLREAAQYDDKVRGVGVERGNTNLVSWLFCAREGGLIWKTARSSG